MKDPRALYDHFKDIDFLIGDRWELRKLGCVVRSENTDLEWATAAMSASRSSGGVADSMSDVHKVERIVEARVERDRMSPKS
ncbi:hypothetical protein ACIQUM_21470 [Amycolatopsis azurea]|uniref:hypothetical protein n=1 Tax=Amycolatopsis azurea TaxID=36819 RepID=UPI00382BDFF1